MIDVLLYWLLISLITFLGISCGGRRTNEPMKTWDTVVWTGSIIFSILVPIGIVFIMYLWVGKDRDVIEILLRERGAK